MCTNEPEVCGFMTNDLRAGKMSIQKCDKCRDGYLIVKTGTETDFFLGCTNYKKNSTGCDKTISKKSFYEQMKYSLEEVTTSKPRVVSKTTPKEMQETSQFDPWVRKIPWGRDRLPTPVFLGFPVGSDGKESTCNARDLGSISGLGRSPGGGQGNPLHYFCLENPHRQRSLEGYSPWDCKESDTT